MRIRVLRLIVCVLAVCVQLAQLEAQEWTRFRGPNGTGESECKTIPAQWTDKDIAWTADVPGEGHSSPVVWGDKVFLFSADPETATRHCLCYSATTGKKLWQVDHKSQTHLLHQRSSYGSSTPTVDEQHVYFAWSSPEETTLLALDHNGKQAWRKNLGRWVSQHGFGTSPIIHGELLILNNAQDDEAPKTGEQPGQSFLMAFDRKTGDEKWRTPLKADVVSYSVPMILETAGRGAEVVCTNTVNGVFGVNLATGEMTWSVPNCFGGKRTVSSPVLAGGLIFGSCGSGAYSDNSVVAVKPGENGAVAYELKNSSKIKAPYVPSLVKRDDLLFLLYDKGFAACVDAATGKIHWSERTDAAFSGSPVRVDDKIYCIDELGVVWVFAAEKEYKVLAKNQLNEPSRSTPAVANGKMFLRTYSHLICIGGKS